MSFALHSVCASETGCGRGVQHASHRSREHTCRGTGSLSTQHSVDAGNSCCRTGCAHSTSLPALKGSGVLLAQPHLKHGRKAHRVKHSKIQPLTADRAHLMGRVTNEEHPVVSHVVEQNAAYAKRGRRVDLGRDPFIARTLGDSLRETLASALRRVFRRVGPSRCFPSHQAPAAARKRKRLDNPAVIERNKGLLIGVFAAAMFGVLGLLIPLLQRNMRLTVEKLGERLSGEINVLRGEINVVNTKLDNLDRDVSVLMKREFGLPD